MNRAWVRAAGIATAWVAMLAGCGGEGARATCVTGQAVACACPGGGDGVQICNPSGAYDVCRCEPDVDAGSDADVSVDADLDSPTDADSADADGGSGHDVGHSDGSDAGDAAEVVTEEVVLPAAGGEVNAAGVTIVVPAGAVPTDTAITIACRAGQSRPGYTVYSDVCTFAPEGLTFTEPLSIRIPFDGDSDRAAMFWSRPAEEGAGYERLGGRVAGAALEAEVWHFSEGFVADGVDYGDPYDRTCVRARPIDLRVSPDGKSAVAVFVGVEDCRGVPIPGLELADFEVSEDGTRVGSEAAVALLPAGDRQAFVTLSIDMSASTLGIVDGVIGAAHAFVDQIEADGLPVHIAVEAFAGMRTADVLLRHTLDLTQVRGALDSLADYMAADVSSTNLHGAIQGGMERLADARGALERRNYGGALTTGYLVLFTDGADTAGYVTAEAARAAAAASADRLMVVGLIGPDHEPLSILALEPDFVLTSPALATLRRELMAVANRIARQVGSTYLVGYCSPKRSGIHTVSIAVADAPEGGSAAADFNATGFGPGCTAEFLSDGCTGLECGGLACGACDDRVEACTVNGTDYTCVDLCVLQDECADVAVDTPLGYTLVCPSSPERTECGGACRDTTADMDHCGGCGLSCVNATACVDAACVCTTGWSGAACDEATCSGGCGAHGRCVAPEACLCDTGWGGGECDVAIAPGFVWIPGGTFLMGTHGLDAWDVYEPQHRVTISRGFLLQATEVTQGQWKELSGGVNPSCFQSTAEPFCRVTNANDDAPVERVDWFSVLAFANAMSVRDGLTPCYTISPSTCADTLSDWAGGNTTSCTRATFSGLDCDGYRLPTEAEWEYAGRAGTTTETYAGDLVRLDCTEPVLQPIAWFCGNSGDRTQAVGTKDPNAWGLHDMLGNVEEWVWDCYGQYVVVENSIDPLGLLDRAERVTRGGSFEGFRLRLASRSALRPEDGNAATGFRLARSLP